MNFWGADAPQKFMRGAYIINEFFFATCGTKIRRIFYPPKSVIVLRQFGWIFWGANAPPKIIRGAYIINIFFFATFGTKIRRIFETSYYVSLGGFFWGDTNNIATSWYCVLFFAFYIFAIRQSLMRDLS